MFKERFENLMKIFHEGAEGKVIDLKELFTQSLSLFEDLKEELKHGTPEERKETLAMMTEMYKRMLEETKNMCQVTGMSEEQLIAFSENPSNFSKDQWEMIQDARLKIHRVGQGLIKVFEAANQPHHVGQEHKVVPISKRTKKTKKSDWKRS